jgi:hypothetical protein
MRSARHSARATSACSIAAFVCRRAKGDGDVFKYVDRGEKARYSMRNGFFCVLIAGAFFILPYAAAADAETDCPDGSTVSKRRHGYPEPSVRRRHSAFESTPEVPMEQQPPCVTLEDIQRAAREQSRIEGEMREADRRRRLNIAYYRQRDRDERLRQSAYQNSTFELQREKDLQAQVDAYNRDAMRYGTFESQRARDVAAQEAAYQRDATRYGTHEDRYAQDVVRQRDAYLGEAQQYGTYEDRYARDRSRQYDTWLQDAHNYGAH